MKTKGLPPPAVYNHTIEYYQRSNAIIVIGGRKDVVSESDQCSVSGKIFLYYLNYNTWQEVTPKGIVQPRCAHVSAKWGTKIVLYGGIGDDRYLDSDVTLIELDQTSVFHKLARDKTYTQQTKQLLSNNIQKEVPTVKRKIELWDDLPVHSKKKSTLMERFHSWQNHEVKIKSFLPVPQKKSPKIRYDLFQAFLTTFLIQHNDELLKIFNFTAPKKSNRLEEYDD